MCCALSACNAFFTRASRALLELPKVLHPHNRVFLEWGGERPELPERFEWLREKQAGQVGYGLASYRHAA